MEAAGYILRIAAREWVNQVFSVAMYYTSFHRKWAPGKTILFVHKTDVGDAIVGYGIIEGLHKVDELSEEEGRDCEKHGWRKAIEFKYVMRFEKPLSIKETFLKEPRFRGRYMHGLQLGKDQLNSLVNQAELRQR